MDYVDWLQTVLAKVVEVGRNFSPVGVDDGHIAASVLGDRFVGRDAYFVSDQRIATYETLQELIRYGFVEEKGKGSSIRVLPTQRGRELVDDPLPFWEEVCSIRLYDGQEQALRYFNAISQKVNEGYALLESVSCQDFPSPHDNDSDKQMLRKVAKELQGIGLLKVNEYLGPNYSVRSTYTGLIWEHRRECTLEAKLIDQLVQEWETTSVDFKRELYVDNENQKAEFIKDILSLANTQASGRRWMIIGFDDKTRSFHTPPDPKLSQNRLEQLLAHYTSPVVDIRYEVVGYRSGQVGKIEVFRDAKKLPYIVAALVGNKKSISVGQMFVRHGSQVEEPTDLERDSITEEGERARNVGL